MSRARKTATEESAASSEHRSRNRAIKITAFYAVFAISWIYLSDRALLYFITDQEVILRLSVYKGLAFVMITSLLLFGLIWRSFRKTEASHEALRLKDTHLRVSEHKAAEIVRMASSAIITLDESQKITDFNPSAESMFLCPTAEAIGKPITDFIPSGLSSTKANEMLLQGRRSNGEKFSVEAGISRLDDQAEEFYTLYLRDISERLAHEAEIERLRRLYASLSQINQAIVWTKDRKGLLEKVCRTLVEFGGLSTAWVGRHDKTTNSLCVEASWGATFKVPAEITLPAGNESSYCRTTIRALNEKKAIFEETSETPTTDTGLSSRVNPQRFASAASFPINEGGQIVGILTVYSSDKGFFQAQEVALLEEAATDIAYALENLKSEAARIISEEMARDEKLFSSTMIDSMPGILYFYDMRGHFLRWNRNFETVSGYSSEEIARMHPLDFFEPQERPLITERIGEVFTKGESSVEAPFLSKNGTTRPYFFTGRQVEFQGRPCLVGVGIDIYERKMAEAALRQSEYRYRTTLDNILEGCQLISYDWRYLYLNDAAVAHNRRPKKDLLGRTMPEVWPGIEKSPVYTVIERTFKDRVPGQQLVEFQFPDGSKGWFDMRVQPVDEGALILSVERTEQKLANDLLVANEQKYRELVENANSIILRWNSDGQITFLNEYGQKFFGYETEEIIGHHVMDTIVPATESSGRNLQKLMAEICANPKAFEHNVNENRLRSGQHVWIAWTNRIVRNKAGQVQEILSIGTDITAQKMADEALRRSEEQFRLIMENLADLVAVVDLEGKRLYNSPSYGGILGNPDKLLGSSSFQQIHPEDQQRVREAFEDTIRTGVGHRLEYKLLDQNGYSHYIESQGSVIRDNQGKPAQVVVVSRDVTERKQSEMALRVLNETLEQEVLKRTADLKAALIRAEAADRIKSAFLATMSHELRTPLNSIIGFTGIILQGLAGPLNAEQTKQLSMVRGSARHLLELINDVLDISKIEAGQLEVRAEPFDLPASIERVIASIKPMADKKSLTLSLNRPAGLSEMTSDRRRLEQVLINLLNNAIKFTDTGSVSLNIECLPAWNRSPKASPVPAVKFVIKDSGMGIKPENLSILFQPFRQIDTGLSRQHEGTGLGLAICKRLVHLMGGDISANSVWQQGSEFTVTLPLKKPEVL